ncbi:MAG: helix-turn-helix domain-containing protein [Deinococcota bacterium]
MNDKTMSDEELAAWEASRDLGEEILQGIQEIKAGKTGRRYTAKSFPIIRTRESLNLSQQQFAELLGVSVRTLQDWEQGRREPSGAAQTLLKVASRHPEVLRELVTRIT